MIKRFPFIFYFYLSCRFLSFSQNIIIRGNVQTPDKNESPAYNITLLHKKDSVFYKAAFFESKAFKIDVNKKDLPLIMKITSLEYRDTLIDADINKLVFPDIQLKANLRNAL